MKKRLFVLLIVLGLCGCIKEIRDGQTTYRLDPNEAAKYEQTVEVSGSILQALVPIFPWLAPIVAGGAGVYATYKQQKPKFLAEQSRADMYHNTAGSLVAIVEKFKETNPAEYEKLRDKLEDTIDKDVENVIRALRGLPPKA